jgi:hypothetical protein
MHHVCVFLAYSCRQQNFFNLHGGLPDRDYIVREKLLQNSEIIQRFNYFILRMRSSRVIRAFDCVNSEVATVLGSIPRNKDKEVLNNVLTENYINPPLHIIVLKKRPLSCPKLLAPNTVPCLMSK